MYPVLFKIPVFGGIAIYSYGVMVALGFLAAMAWISYEAKRLGQNPSKAMDLVFYVIVAAIVGSRILYVIVAEWDRFLRDPLVLFKIWEGGLVFYGGLIASVIVGTWYIRRNKMPILIFFDIFAPAIALGHALGRIGCFLSGCCYGRIVDHPAWYSVVFPPNVSSFAPGGIPLYPTQLMEFAGEFLIFLFLVLFRKRKKFDGQVLATYFLVYAVLRTVVEHFRGDAGRGLIAGNWLSTSVFISIFIFAAGVGMYVKLGKKSDRSKIG